MGTWLKFMNPFFRPGRMASHCSGCGEEVPRKHRLVSLAHHGTVLCPQCHEKAKQSKTGQIKVVIPPKPKITRKVDKQAEFKKGLSRIREIKPIRANASKLARYTAFIKEHGHKPRGRPPFGYKESPSVAKYQAYIKKHGCRPRGRAPKGWCP